MGGLSHCFLALDPAVCAPGFPGRLQQVLDILRRADLDLDLDMDLTMTRCWTL